MSRPGKRLAVTNLLSEKHRAPRSFPFDQGGTLNSSNKRRSSFLDSVHAVETAFSKGSETVCGSPLCDVRFEQTGMEISPKRFHSDRCKQEASLIRRVSKLLDGLTDEKKLEALRGR
jgi:hypothetical protein